MDIQESNYITVIGNRVTINGEVLPPVPGKGDGECVTILNGKVYIDGYEFKNGEWKKTIKSVYYYWHSIYYYWF